MKKTLERLRSARLFHVVSVYILASWVILQVVDLLTAQFGLPGWFFHAGLALLLVGLPIISATAIVQGRSVQSRGEVDQARRMPAPAEGVPHRLFTWKLAILGGVLAFIVLGSVGFGMIWLLNRGRALQADVVTVMPFHVVGDGVELWREGMVDLMATALDATGQYRASDPRAVLNRWRRAAADPDELPEPRLAGDVAGSLGAGHMILGSLIRTGPSDVRISADLYSVRWLRRVASAAVEGGETDVTGLVDRLTVNLLRSIWQGDRVPDIRVSAITTTSIPALRAYLEGEQAFRRSQFDRAISSFTAAVDADSTFAIAHYRLGLSHGWTSGITGDLQLNLTRAARHTHGLPERDSLLIQGWKLADVDGDLDAVRLFERLTARYPDDLEAWYGLGEAYFHIGAQAGHRPEDSVDPFVRALALDSTFAPTLIHPIEVAYVEADSARAWEWTRLYLSLDSTSYYAQGFGLLTPLAFGSPDESAAARQALDTAGTELLGWVSARLRPWGASNLSLQERVELARGDARHPSDERGQALWWLAAANLRNGRIMAALDLYDQALPLASGGLDEPTLFVLSVAREVGLADRSVDGMIERLEKRVGSSDAGLMALKAIRDSNASEALAAVALMQAQADSLLEAGDSSIARSVQGQVWALRGRIAAGSDSVDAAIDDLRRGLPMISALWTWPRDVFRYWLAGLIRDRGGEDEALEIYGSLFMNPWLEALGYFERAQLHERRGELDQAAYYYARFLEFWEDADPHLQPRVESARRALERMAGERAIR